MNLEKLKEQCRFCKHFDIGHIDCCSIYGECLYNFDNHNRPIGNTSRWELHPDIAEAITEAIKLEKDTMKQWLLDEGYEILSEKI